MHDPARAWCAPKTWQRAFDNSRSQLTMDDRALLDMETVYPDDTLRILTTALRHRDEIRNLYSRVGRDSVLEFVVKALGNIGDAGAIPALREAMDDALIGRPAIKAIQAIEARSVGIDM